VAEVAERSTVEIPERKHTLRRIKAGDYVFLSNDTKTLWRVSRYEDGPSQGIEDWPKDIWLWGLWRWPAPIVFGETAVELDNWDRWVFTHSSFGRRQEAIDAALEQEAK